MLEAEGSSRSRDARGEAAGKGRSAGASSPSASRPPTSDAGRRAVVIRGHGAEGPPVRRRRPPTRRHERTGVRPDRIAMWAVVLGVLLVLVAATSSHAAATRSPLAGGHPAAAGQGQVVGGGVLRTTRSR